MHLGTCGGATFGARCKPRSCGAGARPSSRAAFAVAWLVFLLAAALALCKVLSRDGGDVTGLQSDGVWRARAWWC